MTFPIILCNICDNMTTNEKNISIYMINTSYIHVHNDTDGKVKILAMFSKT